MDVLHMHGQHTHVLHTDMLYPDVLATQGLVQCDKSSTVSHLHAKSVSHNSYKKILLFSIEENRVIKKT